MDGNGNARPTREELLIILKLYEITDIYGEGDKAIEEVNRELAEKNSKLNCMDIFHFMFNHSMEWTSYGKALKINKMKNDKVGSLIISAKCIF